MGRCSKMHILIYATSIYSFIVGMEPRWVLTSGQKKIRFRNLLKKRRSNQNSNNTNNQEDELEDPDKRVTNNSVGRKSPENRSQQSPDKRSYRSFSDDVQTTQNKVHTNFGQFKCNDPPSIPISREGKP